jgi:signal transduction histidine kinase
VAAPRTLAARLGSWRNLRLPVKLAVVTLVPLIVLITLGAVLVHGELANAGQYARANRITELSQSVRASISALQDERQQVATPNAAPAKGMAGLLPARAMTLPLARREVDQVLAATRQGVVTDVQASDLDPVADAAWSSAQRLLHGLPSLRAAISAPNANRSTEVSSYTQLVDSLFAFDRVLTTDLADARLTRQALSTYDLFAAREEIRYQQSVVLAGIGTSTMSVADVTSLHGSEARLDSRISDFQAVASQSVGHDFDTSVDASTLGHQSELLAQAIDQSGGMSGQVISGMAIGIPVATWNAANDAITAGLNQVISNLATSLSSTAATLRSDASGSAATAVIVLVIAIAATVALVVLIARQLVLSIGLLRRTARDVASRQLPDAVERIRAGEAVDTEVEPVGVHTSDEVGQLARAFDAVHGEALRLAVEQAGLRAAYSELFVNLSRRSQSLVQRQLRLIEQLERDEEDPDQLSALFKLDHLATRMRRNNENLMVLSGGELGRGSHQQVSLADLVRAAVSEIEHYQRVTVQPPPEAHIVGYAAGDLVRLLAELLDNATAFSAPDTPVTVASHRTRRKAVVIDIVDHGIGMTDEELSKANEQLSHPAGVEGRISRRMGLFVISRLADQHDIRVRLHGGQDIPGLRVTITVPADLVIGEPEPLPRDDDTPGQPVPPPAPPVPPRGNNGSGPLPKRTVGATSGPNGVWHNALRGTLDAPAPTLPDPVAAADPVASAASTPDPVAGAMTVTIPQLPSALSSGVGLFAPLSDEDESRVGIEPGGGEAAAVTPIFDTLSAWFEDTPEPAESAQRDEGWQFAADEGWQAVGAVADVEPDEFTEAGLPKRQPKAFLVPGSVRHEAAPDPVPTLSADRLRQRLAGFQLGLQRGRHAAAGDPADEDTVRAEPVGTRPRPTFGMPMPELPGGSDVAPAEVTSAGLPRRRPKEHLLPGSVAEQVNAPAAPRDPGAMRDRLSSFQRGVREGRGGTEPATEAASVEHGFQW